MSRADASLDCIIPACNVDGSRLRTPGRLPRRRSVRHRWSRAVQLFSAFGTKNFTGLPPRISGQPEPDAQETAPIFEPPSIPRTVYRVTVFPTKIRAAVECPGQTASSVPSTQSSPIRKRTAALLSGTNSANRRLAPWTVPDWHSGWRLGTATQERNRPISARTRGQECVGKMGTGGGGELVPTERLIGIYAVT